MAGDGQSGGHQDTTRVGTLIDMRPRTCTLLMRESRTLCNSYATVLYVYGMWISSSRVQVLAVAYSIMHVFDFRVESVVVNLNLVIFQYTYGRFDRAKAEIRPRSIHLLASSYLYTSPLLIRLTTKLQDCSPHWFFFTSSLIHLRRLPPSWDLQTHICSLAVPRCTLHSVRQYIESGPLRSASAQ